MSSATRSDAAPAPWKSTFLEHVGTMPSPEFVLSSLHPAPTPSSSNNSAEPQFVPRARYCIFRGMWTELPENKHNQAPMNPRVYESEMPTLTTDVRMLKVGEVDSTGAGLAGGRDKSKKPGSGGGGPVEAVFWVKDIGTQWRIRGHAFFIGPDIDTGDSGESATSKVRQELRRRMKIVDATNEEQWSWAKELTAHFGNNSPGIRGSFRAPPPGQSVDKPYDERLKLGDKVEDLDDELARENFRIMIIRPDEVEQLDLSDPKTARRHTYTYNDNKGSWSIEEQWP